MGAAEDIINKKLEKPGANEMDINRAQTDAEAARNKPSGMSPDAELNWVQKMTKQVHDYLTKKKKESQLPLLEEMPEGNYSKKALIYPDLEKKAEALKAAGKNPAEIDLMKRQIANRRGVE